MTPREYLEATEHVGPAEHLETAVHVAAAPPTGGGRHRRYDRLKRVLDLLVAAALLVLLSPVLLGCAGAVAVALGRPVLFRQTRPGRHGQLFELRKFRTMRPAAPGRTSDADRLTRFGGWLRATSLDELPTLWNVLRGEMSLVGPRPLLVSYLDRYTPEQARRHEVRPGITGLAQVRGRNELSWEEKFRHDVRYVEDRCLALDLRILLATVLRVLRRQGISAPGSPTMPEFAGTGSRLVGAEPGPGRGADS
ncbi:sugar transferase [Plantactinospora endophytica]|uniref:UDP-phosphate galactose phosphotransferase n=1 Tax=Plantactinospora endophytica TaxID=673535 RepID=A0ABQ4EAC6_9ACTN|nr:sugar transferase [Plantactinospora endophytica]GIG91692.1 UDP-phosphate galactose phosphotransferase [Plantactinospora endophytica]